MQELIDSLRPENNPTNRSINLSHINNLVMKVIEKDLLIYIKDKCILK